ncbi:WUSCHEL-related homeobox 11-like [Cannabis sativa]|uniref:WUSCHEL-related homeobox 11-like n=1 Tax=Cannabis sativa TaxID=3483 RepID=UPI0029C9F3D3|nr:WUSCHEL-related homeobox 11-like [Cannabis sativa]
MDQDHHHHHHQGQQEHHHHYYSSNSPNGSDQIRINNNNNDGGEPAVRSRWTPKPEQILILESIFNSGMVNPPKDETVRIRKLLEKFGAVGDANVFYWFQNRRSRSRRRQRQLQAQLNNIGSGGGNGSGSSAVSGGGVIQYESNNNNNIITSTTTANNTASSSSGNNTHTTTTTASAIAVAGFGGCGFPYSFLTSSPSNNSSPSNSTSFDLMGGGCSSSNSCGGFGDDHHGRDGHGGLFGHMSFPEIEQSSLVTSALYHPESSNMHFQLSDEDMMTVFINGVATEVAKGPIDLKAMFGDDAILVHSSGVAVPINDFGILLHSLQPHQSYFLVPRSSLGNN